MCDTPMSIHCYHTLHGMMVNGLRGCSVRSSSTPFPSSPSYRYTDAPDQSFRLGQVSISVVVLWDDDGNGVEDDLTEHPLSPFTIISHSTTACVDPGHQYMPWYHTHAVVAADPCGTQLRWFPWCRSSNHTPHRYTPMDVYQMWCQARW